MNSGQIQQEYAAARIADLHEAACHANLVRRVRQTRGGTRRFNLHFLARR